MTYVYTHRKTFFSMETYEMKISPAILLNKKCHSNQQLLASKCEWGLPKLQSRGCCHPPKWLQKSWGNERSRANKETGLAPDSWDVYDRIEFCEPRGWYLPMHNMLNFLICYLIFDVQTVCSFCCKLVYSLTSPPAPWNSFLRSYEILSPRLRILNILTK